MGTRIEFYAVDIPPFEQFLDRPLADVLRFAARSGSSGSFLWFHTGSGRYLASPEYGILFDDRQGRGKGYAHPTEAELDADPSLAISCRRHLALSDTGELGGLVRVLSGSDATPWLHELSHGYYWFWVCSLLDALHSCHAFPTDDCERYEALFTEVLGGNRCGRSKPEPDVARKQPVFPVIPQRDHEHWRMGIWTVEDVALFVTFTHRLLASDISFSLPPEPEIHITDWNEWVLKMLRHILAIERLGYAKPNIISFIG